MNCLEYRNIEDKISNLYEELDAGDYDRAEIRLHGTDIRVWETRINCKSKIHLGYKPVWENNYRFIKKMDLVEFLYKRKDVN